MVRLFKKNFNLKQICDSGQCFRMKELPTDDETEKEFEIIAGDKYVRARQEGYVTEMSCTPFEFQEFWAEYFDLETDYEAFIDSVDENDEYLKKAAEYGNGIRILKQDLWEMIVTFLISQQNNIKRIRKCVELICEKYGNECESIFGNTYYAFPKPETLVDLESDALMECNLGYRSKYVVDTAKKVVSGEIDLDAISKMNYADARKELLKLFGVGEKVADCIALFALHHLEAFPVDTHIKQVFEKEYPEGFPFEKYQGYSGVLQQYIFYYDLKQ